MCEKEKSVPLIPWTWKIVSVSWSALRSAIFSEHFTRKSLVDGFSECLMIELHVLVIHLVFQIEQQLQLHRDIAHAYCSGILGKIMANDWSTNASSSFSSSIIKWWSINPRYSPDNRFWLFLTKLMLCASACSYEYTSHCWNSFPPCRIGFLAALWAIKIDTNVKLPPWFAKRIKWDIYHGI